MEGVEKDIKRVVFISKSVTQCVSIVSFGNFGVKENGIEEPFTLFAVGKEEKGVFFIVYPGIVIPRAFTYLPYEK
jgi:hypothetical protein